MLVLRAQVPMRRAGRGLAHCTCAEEVHSVLSGQSRAGSLIQAALTIAHGSYPAQDTRNVLSTLSLVLYYIKGQHTDCTRQQWLQGFPQAVRGASRKR